MDLADVVSSVLALAAIIVSGFTYFRTEKQQKRNEFRQFLVESAHATDMLVLGLYRYVRFQDENALKDTMPITKELSVLNLKHQWPQGKAYKEWDKLMGAIPGLGDALEKFITEKDQSADTVVDAMKQLYEAADEYRMKAREVLREL